MKQSDDQSVKGNVLDAFNDHIDLLAKFLNESMSDLEKVSTLHVYLVIPDEVREYLVRRHGDEAREGLRRLDDARNQKDKFVLKGFRSPKTEEPP